MSDRMQRPVFEDEHIWFRESVRGFVDRELLPCAEAIREERAIPRSLWRRAGEQGLLGLGRPSRIRRIRHDRLSF